MTLKEWLEQNKKLCEAATEELWTARAMPGNFGHTILAGRRHVVVAATPMLHGKHDYDADFIASARTALPQALAIIESILEFADHCMDELDRRRILQLAEEILNPKADEVTP